MKALVIGLGSMGRRRIKILQKIKDIEEVFGVDTKEERRRKVSEELGVRAFASVSEVLVNNKLDLTVISTSPLAHAKLVQECLDNNLHVFTELNLVITGYDEAIKKAKEKNLILFMSSTLLYRREIEYIGKKLEEQGKANFSYMYHVGQYLPDWHPWENYKDFFASDERTNAVKELMAIEFPWLIRTFGKIKGYEVKFQKNSSLDITFPDTCYLNFEHEHGKGMLVIDVISRKAVRRLEVFNDELYITWDGTPNGLLLHDIENKKENKVELYEDVEQFGEYWNAIIENAYQSELEEYVAAINNREIVPRYSFAEDKKVLELIDSITGGAVYDK